MKFLSVLAIVLTLGVTLATDVEAAKRLGGGKTSGMQRQSLPADKTAAPGQPQAPAAAPSAPHAQPAAGVPQAQPKRSWMGPLAGLAAGIGLAALASHFGFGEQLASMLMIGLLVMAVMVVIGLIMRRKAAGQRPANSLQYATAAENEAPKRAFEVAMPASGTPVVASAPVVAARHVPADFDATGFARNAKVNFIRLQAANDAGNLEDIREFTTPEMFAEIKMDILERGGAPQRTEVVSLHAEVVDVAEEALRHVVSVRFSGLIREEKDAQPESIDEIWHLVKPRDGKSGWLLAGIQQTQ